MNFKAILAFALFVLLPIESRAWVISDRVTDVFTTADGEFLITRRVRRNEELKAEETVWDFFTRSSPGRPVIVLGIQDGALAHRWDLDETLTYPKKAELRKALEKVKEGDGSQKLAEADIKTLLTKKLRMAPLPASPACGAQLTKEKTGYTLKVGGFARKLGWVHANADGKPYERLVERCFAAGSDVLAVVISMKGTATSKGEDGKLTRFPNFESERVIWTFEPPKL